MWGSLIMVALVVGSVVGFVAWLSVWHAHQHAFPRPSNPTPHHTLVYCHILEASDWVEQSNSPARLQFNDAIKKNRRPKFQKKSHHKSQPLLHPLADSAPTQPSQG
jgi:hypothetical protein